MSATFAVRLDAARVLQDDEGAAASVAEILSRPSFASLDRVAGRSKDRWMDHVPRSVEAIGKYLRDPRYDAVSLDSKGKELVASAELETSLRKRAAGATSLVGYVVCPVGTDFERFVNDVCDLAGVFGTGAGFVAAEPSYAQAHRISVGASRPKEREGLSEGRQRGRRARDWKSELLATKIATVEWGTFLGGGHLAQIDLDQVRASGAFDRVVQVSPSLAFLQTTANPLDDLTGELERKFPQAREALQPLLMDIGDVNLE